MMTGEEVRKNPTYKINKAEVVGLSDLFIIVIEVFS